MVIEYITRNYYDLKFTICAEFNLQMLIIRN